MLPKEEGPVSKSRAQERAHDLYLSSFLMLQYLATTTTVVTVPTETTAAATAVVTVATTCGIASVNLFIVGAVAFTIACVFVVSRPHVFCRCLLLSLLLRPYPRIY